jgi:glycosyltransferase involved in cell wall biosynthesis
MRIAQVAPLYESVPPLLYGGTERVVSYLTEELVRQGHEVTLFASGDSRTAARLVPASRCALWRDADVRDTRPQHLRLMELVFRDVSRFDVIHFHCDFLQLPLLRRHPCAAVTTLHGEMRLPDVADLFREFSETPVVSISDSQRRPIPWANWRATVHHGLPSDLHTFRARPRGDYLAFLGRICGDKGTAEAIEIAARAKMKLKIAAKVDSCDREYYESKVVPLMRKYGSLVELVGEIGGAAKDEFLGNARAVLFPIRWEEPFGLVMIEALACGTPVIAFRRGSVSEILVDGVTGWLVETLDQAVAATARIDAIDRHACRAAFQKRFTAARMANDYLTVYRNLIGEGGSRRSSGRRAAQAAAR